MGVRGELFSTKVGLQNRTYFFNVKENRLGDLYLNIVESKNRDEGGFERQSVILFAEDLQEFLKGFDESLRVLEKAYREKRRGKRSGEEKEADRAFTERDTEPSDRRFADQRSAAGARSSRPSRSSGSLPAAPARYREESSRFRDGPQARGPRAPGFQGRGQGRKTDRPPARGASRSRIGKKEYEYGTEEKRDFPPRKKRVVVKKR